MPAINLSPRSPDWPSPGAGALSRESGWRQTRSSGRTGPSTAPEPSVSRRCRPLRGVSCAGQRTTLCVCARHSSHERWLLLAATLRGRRRKPCCGAHKSTLAIVLHSLAASGADLNGYVCAVTEPVSKVFQRSAGRAPLSVRCGGADSSLDRKRLDAAHLASRSEWLCRQIGAGESRVCCRFVAHRRRQQLHNDIIVISYFVRLIDMRARC